MSLSTILDDEKARAVNPIGHKPHLESRLDATRRRINTWTVDAIGREHRLNSTQRDTTPDSELYPN
jgi:hypothetical protein